MNSFHFGNQIVYLVVRWKEVENHHLCKIAHIRREESSRHVFDCSMVQDCKE